MRSLRPPMEPCDDEFTRDHAPDENRPSVFIAIVHSISGAWLAGVSDSLDGVLAVIELFAELDEKLDRRQLGAHHGPWHAQDHCQNRLAAAVR